MNGVTFQSNVTMVEKQMLGNMEAAAAELEKESVEWVQEQMLYGYHDRHGMDGHTEIYDTGVLIDTLKAEVKKDSQNTYTVSVGSPQKYAVYVHNGTHKLKARPFIRDALTKNTAKIRAITERNLKNGF